MNSKITSVKTLIDNVYTTFKGMSIIDLIKSFFFIKLIHDSNKGENFKSPIIVTVIKNK